MTGTIKLDDGTPLSGGTVFFDDGTISGYSQIQPTGTYSMGLVKDGEGIPPGQYKVYLTSPVDTDVNPDGIAIVDPKFTTYASTTLSYEVKKGQKNIYDFEVEYNPTLKSLKKK